MAAAIPVIGLALLAGCGGHATKKQAAAPVIPAAKSKTCTAGSIKMLGSPKLAYAAVVRSSAAVYRRPGAPAFARFGKLNVNGVPTIFWIRGARLDAGCKPRQYLVQIPSARTG